MLVRSCILAVLLTIAGGASAAAPAAACGKVIISGDPAYPPYSWHEGGEMRGSAISIVKLALERMHIPYEVRYVGPFLRMLVEAQLGHVDIIAELKNLPERQEYLTYSAVPIFSNPVAVFVRADSKLSYKKWEDLAEHRGGMTLGNKFGGGFDEFAARNLRTEVAGSIEQNFGKLGFGRVNYFVNSYYPAQTFLIAQNRESEFKALQPFITDSANFVGWSKRSACVGRLAEFDTVLAAMAKSGEVKRIIDASIKSLRNPIAKK